MTTDIRPTAPADSPALTVYYDGACPVCSREIAHYQRQPGAQACQWVDAASCPPEALGPGLQRVQALGRFHVRLPDGRLLVLERAQVVGGGGLVNRLLAIDLTACGGATACPVTEHQVLEGEDEAANHEGMTTLDGPQGQRWVLLVSDDRGARRQGTRFQLVVGP
mgnify:CR=1 FL=1